MKYRFLLLLYIAGALIIACPFSVEAHAQTGQARVVYFSSPGCGYCQQLESQDFPVLHRRYGKQWHLFTVDTSTALGRSLFEATVEFYELPPRRRYVPLMIVAEHILVGLDEVRAQLDRLVEQSLAADGNDWPAIPGLEAQLVMAANQVERTPQRLPPFQRDLPGNYVSVALLLVMVPLTVSIARPARWQRRLADSVSPWFKIGIALAGLGCAGYLSYAELTHTEAMCGPIGQCDLVQQSEMAVLFGFLPTALFGVFGYLAMVGVYLYGYWNDGPNVVFMPLTGYLLSAFGFAFSVVLTYWQPFVIGATCMWCLGSAVSMTLSALVNAVPGWKAIGCLRRTGTDTQPDHRFARHA